VPTPPVSILKQFTQKLRWYSKALCWRKLSMFTTFRSKCNSSNH